MFKVLGYAPIKAGTPVSSGKTEPSTRQTPEAGPITCRSTDYAPQPLINPTKTTYKLISAFDHFQYAHMEGEGLVTW